MDQFEYLKQNNIVCLQQGIDLLDKLSDDAYMHVNPPVYTSCVGDHYRHCLEHYGSFFKGLPARCIDYDARDRDQRIASERVYAIEVTSTLIKQLNQLSCPKEALQVKMDCRLDEEEGAVWVQSSAERDLQYLQAHTIHHYALIALILRFQGVDPGKEFGIAPSTLTYMKRQLESA